VRTGLPASGVVSIVKTALPFFSMKIFSAKFLLSGISMSIGVGTLHMVLNFSGVRLIAGITLFPSVPSTSTVVIPTLLVAPTQYSPVIYSFPVSRTMVKVVNLS
jgi:hypothetical protein